MPSYSAFPAPNPGVELWSPFLIFMPPMLHETRVVHHQNNWSYHATPAPVLEFGCRVIFLFCLGFKQCFHVFSRATCGPRDHCFLRTTASTICVFFRERYVCLALVRSPRSHSPSVLFYLTYRTTYSFGYFRSAASTSFSSHSNVSVPPAELFVVLFLSFCLRHCIPPST